MKNTIDLLGVGIGPFNLSLAALLAPLNKMDIKFCDVKSELNWHPELMFDMAPMQTSFLKDLVTPVDPTNPYSFLNHLVENGQFYQFLNTSRSSISRFEFETYLKWVAAKLGNTLEFKAKVENINYKDGYFVVNKSSGEVRTKNLCIASGPTQKIPDVAKEHIGENVFHAKSKHILNLNVENKNVLVVGGGQTGLEVFRNILNEKWGKSSSVKLITGRESLLPLDEGPFTNEIFSPDFVEGFYNLNQRDKDSFNRQLMLASDGNTPSYLQEFYNELYLDQYYLKKYSDYEIHPMHWLEDIQKIDNSFCAIVRNRLKNDLSEFKADIIILATGFSTGLPEFMNDLKDVLEFDEQGRMSLSLDYKLKSTLPKENAIYAMNYSLHQHGIADPQTSLMSWRSSVIANSLLGHEHYKQTNQNNSFLEFFSKGHSNE